MKRIIVYALLLGLPINTLLPIPLDKLAMFCMCIVGTMILIQQNLAFSTLSLITLVTAFVSILLAIFVNILSFVPVIVFPLLGIYFINVYSRLPFAQINDKLYKVLSYNSLVSILLWAMSYLVGLNSFVRPLIDKNMPFVHAAQGFCSTPQVLGTLCLTAVFLYIIRSQKVEAERGLNKILLLVNGLAIFASVNRVSILLFIFMLFFINRRLFFAIIGIGLGCAIYFFEIIKENLLNVSTLQSRSDLLHGFDESFFYYNNPLGMIFGKGDPYIDTKSLANTMVDSAYVENGTAALIHLYGFLGLLIYLIVSIYIISYALRQKSYFICLVIFLYMLIVPQFTHEYYSTSFYVLLAAMLTELKRKKEVAICLA